MTHDVKTTTFESSPKIVHKEKPPNRNAQLLFYSRGTRLKKQFRGKTAELATLFLIKAGGISGSGGNIVQTFFDG